MALEPRGEPAAYAKEWENMLTMTAISWKRTKARRQHASKSVKQKDLKKTMMPHHGEESKQEANRIYIQLKFLKVD